jgi:heptosyltransferase-3
MTIPRHVLIIRTDHLGDMLLTLPMVDVLKAHDVSIRVSVLASAANAEAALHHPLVDDVIVDAFEAKGSRFRGLGGLVAQIRALRCEAAVVVHPTPRLALAVRLARVPLRVGTAYRAYSTLFNRRVAQHRRRPPWRHESEYNVELLAPLGITAKEIRPMRWQVTGAESTAADSILRARGVTDERLVVIHPGNAGSAMNWSAAQYGELGRRFSDLPARVLVTGTSPEAGLAQQVVHSIGAAGMNMAGAFSVPQLAAVLQRSALYVGSATGPTHLAAAVGIPVIALYSPLRSSVPQRWRPLGAQVHLLQPAVDLLCPTCLGTRCQFYHCMERHLGIDAVARLAMEVLRS